MRVRVRFRVNTETGEVETFLVEDVGEARPAADHDAVHDAITADIARVVERNAVIDEVHPASSPVARAEQAPQATDEPVHRPARTSDD